MENVIISQYGNSPVIKSLVAGITDYLDVSSDIELFKKAVFDPSTCYGKGIKIWSRIVAMSVSATIDVSNPKYFGYDGGTTNFTTFDINPFYYPSTSGNKYSLNDTTMQALIMAKSVINIGNATVGSLQKVIRILLGSETFSIADTNNPIIQTGTMTIKIFITGIKPVGLALLKLYIPKAVAGGVKVIAKTTADSFFGFGTDYMVPLGQGLLYSSSTQWNEEVI